MKTFLAWLTLAGLAALWFSMGYFLPPVGSMLIFIHVLCLLLDMGMNGAAQAEWAPANLVGAILVGIGMGFSPYY